MPQYYRRQTKKNGTVYGVRFSIIENGKKINKNLSPFDTKRKAQQAYLDFTANYKPTYEPSIQISTLFDDMLERYLFSNSQYTKESTQYDKPKIFAKFITPYLTGTDVTTYTKSMMNDWQDKMWAMRKKNGERYTYKYLSKIRSNLNSFLTYCETHTEYPNKLRYAPAPKNTDVKKEILFWEIEEFNKFIPVVDDIMWRTFFCFLFYNGPRLGEIQAFYENKYDSKNRTVSIENSLSKKTLDGKYKIVPTKAYKRYTKNVPQNVANQLNEYIEWKRKNNISDKFLFGGDNFLYEKQIRKVLDKYITIAKVKRITPHGFRHSYVSMLRRQGISYKVIASLIGDTEEQVRETYGHLYSDETINAVSLINFAIPEKNE